MTFFIGLLSSCSTIYGIKKIKPFDTKRVEKTIKNLHIDPNDNFLLTPSFKTYFTTLSDTSLKPIAKNHLQPLQALYFDHNGKLTSYFINCYAGGFPNLNWNRNGNLNDFIPQTQAPLDTLLNLNKQLDFIQNSNKIQTAEYTVFIYWSTFMGRQTKRFIKEIKRNVSLADNKKIVKIIYINCDDLFN